MSLRSSLGPYQLVRRIGRGGMGEVHLAIAHGASGFQRKLAIKTLAPELADDAELTRALIREATTAGALHHRNLVAVLGLGVDDGIYYVVMEYLDGGDLASLGARGGPLPEALALHVVHEAALGLGFLHAATDERGLPLGIVHRDVSPANLLVSTAGDVKLADFGIAKATALAGLSDDVAAIAACALAIDPRARFASVDELRTAIAIVQRLRPATGPSELGAWVRRIRGPT